mmetsp:Transcript_41845/g.67149  ORF Transcript_41845/g.67149 Transcript_41845/m.67149 type:complete len:457 (-) Transcript_41845:14-1384(-)|eukprot:CAMPEP_0203781356 /NCGR_PEP_ID=MMETSP0099_2-20121227/10170_1 /ASSEMBLY_ACC=CAM_ASM_000209 /TAXON_ID=96639 /ORGANISM=" , Strain NY0313808BC1" /LENGTH=456 /DNA_ID=CAMNT_0050682293 /DNA_START=91 /DNA_END=1461 /DNA_ORIENTATION=-
MVAKRLGVSLSEVVGAGAITLISRSSSGSRAENAASVGVDSGGQGIHTKAAKDIEEQCRSAESADDALRESALFYVVPGLYNLGNTCFINALLQVLASCGAVVEYVVQARGVHDIGEHSVVDSLAETINCLVAKQGEHALPTMNIRVLHREIVSLMPTFQRGYEQQDSDELLHYLMEAVDKRVLQHTRQVAQRAVVNVMKLPVLLEGISRVNGGQLPLVEVPLNPLEGSIMSQMVCTACASISPMQGTVFRVLPVLLVDSSNSYLVNSLGQALSNFTAQETIDDVQCFGFCKARRKMFRRCSLGRMPKTMCIHLSRRHFDPRSGRMIKLSHFVSFPLMIDFSRYSFHCNSLENDVDTGVFSLLRNFKELHPTTPDRSENNSETQRVHNEQARKGRLFQLNGVIVHHGGAEGGHFTAFRRLGKASWVHISDARIQRVTEQQVLQAEAYMLLYERIRI